MIVVMVFCVENEQCVVEASRQNWWEITDVHIVLLYVDVASKWARMNEVRVSRQLLHIKSNKWVIRQSGHYAAQIHGDINDHERTIPVVVHSSVYGEFGLQKYIIDEICFQTLFVNGAGYSRTAYPMRN